MTRIMLAEPRSTAAPDENADPLQAWWFRTAILIGAIAMLLRHVAHANVADIDMFHEMALIREAIALGTFPLTDLWAYTPTVSPVVHHEWGTGAILYGVVVATDWGWNAVKLLQFALVAALAVFSWSCTVRRGAHPLVAALLVGVAATLLGAGLAPVRAQMFTYLFTAVMLLLLLAHERLGVRLLLLWLPIFALWVNMHGGFVVGLGLFGLFTAESVARAGLSTSWRSALSQHRYLLAALPAMALLVFATPYGIHYPGYVWDAVRLDRALVAEWAPLWDPRVQPQLIVAFVISLLVLLYAVLRSADRRILTGLPLVLIAAYFTIQHQRMAPLYAVVWFCYVPAYVTTTPLHTLVIRLATRYRTLLAVAASVLAIVTGAAMVEARSWELSFPTEPDGANYVFPAGAIQYLQQARFEGNLMTPYDMGAYVSWRLHPQVLISLDSRYEVAYPTEMAEELIAFYHGSDGWEETLQRYPPDAVLVPSGSPVSWLLNEDGHRVEWREVYRDVAYVVFARAGTYSGTGSVVR